MYLACRPRRDNGGEPFLNWLRVQPGLEANRYVGYVNTDLDIVWYNYVQAKLMIIEQKSGSEEYTPSQRTTHSVLDQLLRFAASHPDCRLSTPHRCLPIPPRITYFGLHTLRLEDTSHDAKRIWLGKGRIWIDDHQVSKETLYRFLRFARVLDEPAQEIDWDAVSYVEDDEEPFSCELGMMEAERILGEREGEEVLW